jgi:hypothetical protein
MRYPQLIVNEPENRDGDYPLASLLRGVAAARGWWQRSVRRPESCLELLGQAGPGVLVLEVGRDLVAEFRLLERVAWLCPGAAAVVVGKAANPVLADLAWDLGAAYVLFPPQPLDLLPEVVSGLLQPAAGGADDDAGTPPAE